MFSLLKERKKGTIHCIRCMLGKLWSPSNGSLMMHAKGTSCSDRHVAPLSSSDYFMELIDFHFSASLFPFWAGPFVWQKCRDLNTEASLNVLCEEVRLRERGGDEVSWWKQKPGQSLEVSTCHWVSLNISMQFSLSLIKLNVTLSIKS